MPCPVCGRVMCDCSPKLRGQSTEEMMNIYWNDSRRSREIPPREIPRPFNFLFTTPVEQVVRRIRNFKKDAEGNKKNLVKVKIEEITISCYEFKMILCLAEVYEGRIYCPLRLSVLATDGEVLLRDDDRRGEPKLVLVVDKWKKLVLEEIEGHNYYYAIIAR